MSRRTSAWNLTGDRSAGRAESPAELRPGWVRTGIASVVLFSALFVVLAWRMSDGEDPALTANAMIAKAKTTARSLDDEPALPEYDNSYDVPVPSTRVS